MTGVSVSEMKPDTSTAVVTVMANSRNRRPVMPPMKKTGMKTATSEIVIERMVKATWPPPLIAASIGGSPASMWRTMFSITTIASSTTNPTAIVRPIRDRLSRL